MKTLICAAAVLLTAAPAFADQSSAAVWLKAGKDRYAHAFDASFTVRAAWNNINARPMKTPAQVALLAEAKAKLDEGDAWTRSAAPALIAAQQRWDIADYDACQDYAEICTIYCGNAEWDYCDASVLIVKAGAP